MLELNIGAFHHVGIVTEKPDVAYHFYKAIGYTQQWAGDDPIQKAHILLLTKANHPMIEIIKPLSEDSPVSELLRTKGAGPYHTCYEVIDIDDTSKLLRKMKMLPVNKKTPAVAFNGRHIRFFYSPAIGLLELVEKE